MSSGGVVGFRAAPASQPLPRISSRILCRCVTASGCTEMLATPASMNGWIRLSGLSTIRWASTGRSTASTSEAATTGPMVRFGTKWLSIASKWTSAAPPACARRTSSPRLAKSAASIEGAPTTLSPRSPQNAKRSASSSRCQHRIILQKRDLENGGSRSLLDQLEDLEHWEVHGDYDAADDAADDHDHERLDDGGQRLDGGVDLGFIEVGYLTEHAVDVPGLLADGDHARHHRGEDGLVFERLVDRDALPDRIPALEQRVLHHPVTRGDRRYLDCLKDGHARRAQGSQSTGEAGEGYLLDHVPDLGRYSQRGPSPHLAAVLGVLPTEEPEDRRDERSVDNDPEDACQDVGDPHRHAGGKG